MQASVQAELRLPDDGRQSEMARTLARGTRRMLRAYGYCTVTELGLANGRRADLVALGSDGTIVIVEIKSSLADFRADLKWRFYEAYCDKLLFAIPASVPAAVMPEDAGLIIADGYGAELVRDAVEKRIGAATRKTMMIRIAQAAADRLHRLADPEC